MLRVRGPSALCVGGTRRGVGSYRQEVIAASSCWAIAGSDVGDVSEERGVISAEFGVDGAAAVHWCGIRLMGS